jgi:hypothetical protein
MPGWLVRTHAVATNFSPLAVARMAEGASDTMASPARTRVTWATLLSSTWTTPRWVEGAVAVQPVTPRSKVPLGSRSTYRTWAEAGAAIRPAHVDRAVDSSAIEEKARRSREA